MMTFAEPFARSRSALRTYPGAARLHHAATQLAAAHRGACPHCGAAIGWDAQVSAVRACPLCHGLVVIRLTGSGKVITPLQETPLTELVCVWLGLDAQRESA